MLNGLLGLVFKDNKNEVATVNRFVYEIDRVVRVYGYLKIESSIFKKCESEGDLCEAVLIQLLTDYSFGRLSSLTRCPTVRVISQGAEKASGKITAHYELTTHFVNSYVAKEVMEAEVQAINYFKDETDIIFWLDEIKKKGGWWDLGITVLSSRQVVFFER